jgi:hypothetical protein
MINHLERTRKQVEDLAASLHGDSAKNAAAIQAARDFDVRLSATEGKLIDVHNTGPSEDAFRNPVQLYERLSWMIGPTVGTPGNGSAGADLGPTAQQVAVNDEFRQQLSQISVEVKQLLDAGISSFNSRMKTLGIGAVIQP